MKFKKSPMFHNALLWAEGEILIIVEPDMDDPEYPKTPTPYLRGMCNGGRDYIYTKTNYQLMKLYFQGRLTTKELFLTRRDEPYFIQSGSKEEPKAHIFSEDFHEKYIETIECGNFIYYELSKFMRMENPFEDFLRFWEIYY